MVGKMRMQYNVGRYIRTNSGGDLSMGSFERSDEWRANGARLNQNHPIRTIDGGDRPMESLGGQMKRK